MPQTDSLRGLLDRRPLPDLIEIAAAHGSPVALVGGAVRDALLGRSPADLDLIVEDGLEGFLAAVEARRGRPAASIGDRFQDTRRMRWAGLQIDVAHSQGTIEQDLGRRDFTVNAMAVMLPPARLDPPAVLDPHGGLADLAARLLRQTTSGVLAADPLRTLRAVRYAVALPGFALEERTRGSVRAAAPGLAGVAAERRVTEWLGMLELDGWARGVDLAVQLAVAGPSLGPLRTTPAVHAWAAGEADGEEGAPMARLAALILDLARAEGIEIDSVRRRMVDARWPRRLVTRAARTARWARWGDVDSERLASRALTDAVAAEAAAALANRLARATGEGLPAWAATLARFAERAREPRWVSGRDLLAAGYTEGPRLGRIVRAAASGQVRRRWPDREAALEWARTQAPGGGS